MLELEGFHAELCRTLLAQVSEFAGNHQVTLDESFPGGTTDPDPDGDPIHHLASVITGSRISARRARFNRSLAGRYIATSRLSQGHCVWTCWKSELPGDIVRGTPHYLGHVRLGRHRSRPLPK
jgi:hypothetical protein